MTYEKALNNISQYLIEIDKPGKFNAKTIKWLKELAGEENIATVNEKLIQNLTDATTEFYNYAMPHINHKISGIPDKITEIQNNLKDMSVDLKALIEIMLLQKGDDDDLTNDTIEKLKINEYFFDDEEKEIVRNNIRRRTYIGKEVAVKKIIDFDSVKKIIAKQARIHDALGVCDYIEKF
ncbi:10718_t:CDS:2 [Acaulospora colombiana]|uniref:10718_t:CDS:1 n=1 Tax=Acaulospora colombiana TaxID=27376 RepID=A0ACA9L2V1_9GLOM|nr:10718_t:CDS:2 [Acaulospora colombiana]